MKLKLKINESVSDITEVILQKLPELDLEWEVVENKQGKQFSTEIGDFKIVVSESAVLLSVINDHDDDGLVENVKTLTHIQDPLSTKKVKSMLYGRLCKRFESHSDITYYKKILESILIHENISNNPDAPVGSEGRIEKF